MSITSWQCPYCNQHATITDYDNTRYKNSLHADTKYGRIGFRLFSRRCPNQACKEFDLKVTVNSIVVDTFGNYIYTEEAIMQFDLRPDSIAKPQPDYIPIAIRQDYEEACKILHLSSKASATLSRRCLQGMIRDFWSSKVQNSKNLWEEINAIKNDVDPQTWGALDATRNVGNIGAHMEKDVNLIINVTPEEGAQLIELIEYLFKDWYVARYNRAENSKRVQETAAQKNSNRILPKTAIHLRSKAKSKKRERNST
ncbi:MAG: DUF4145 domain-containing protein [Holosporales bacterium]|jgi:hypothetical protein